jgi:Tfp pilus assembly protein PilN
MPSINMIASRRAEKRRQEQNIRKLLYGVSIEIGCVILVLTGLSIHDFALRGKIVDLSAQIQTLQPKVNTIQTLQDQIAQMQPKVKTLDGAKADTLFWYSNLYEITNSLPDKTWLTALGVAGGGGAPGSAAAPGSADGADPTISLAGLTVNQTLVGEAMLRMNQSPGTDHVDLAFVQQQKTGDTDTVSFQMTAHLKPEPGAEPKGGASNDKKS